MKDLNRARIATIASLALGLAVMGSSASAQPGNEEYCNNLAWAICSWESGQPTIPTMECMDQYFWACMNGYAAISAKPPGEYDQRRHVQLASRSAAPARLR